LPLDDLLASVQSLVDDANTVVASQGMQQAPQALADTLNAARALMVDLQRADTAQKLSDALVAAQGAAQSVSGAVQGVPLLSMRLTELAEKATALPIDPGSITAALDQVRSLVIELRQSGTATNVNGALVSVAQAGQSFQTLSQNLSVLIPKLTAVAASADSVLSARAQQVASLAEDGSVLLSDDHRWADEPARASTRTFVSALKQSTGAAIVAEP